MWLEGGELVDLLDLFVKIGVKDEASAKAESIGSKIKSGLANAGKVAAAGIGLITTAASAAVGGLLALEGATEEYRVAQGKLNTAFEAAGYSTDTAKQAYTGFYKILGDTDTATEASQLLAQLADNEKDVATWIETAAGVYGTFGDSIPIEGLIESANETAKVGEVTGSLADALNWVGISEDQFNEKLAECTDESERNQLIMDTLSSTYADATDAFYENNDSLLASREAQAKMNESLGKLGQSVSDIKTRLVGEFLPSIAAVTEGLAGMLSGTEGASEQFSTAIGSLINTGIAMLPQFLNFGTQILTALLTGIVENIPVLVQAIPQIIQSIYSALQELWPTIQQAGTELLSMLSEGIITYIPELVAKLPEVITAIINFLAENMPKILEKGTEIIANLANGIISKIPDMVSKLPEVITAIVSFITSNLPQILQSGVQILLSIVSGIIQSIPKLTAVVPQIIKAIVSGIKNLLGSVTEVGKNIVEGIWNGIKSMGTWIKSKVSDFFGGIVSGVKSFLGIASPSKVFAGIGENMALGVGKGWDSEYRNIKRNIENGLEFEPVRIKTENSIAGKMNGLITQLSANLSQNSTIIVQSVLDGKVIGETACKYNRNRARAYGV